MQWKGNPDPLHAASVVLARASAFDPTVPAASKVVTQSWADMIARSGLTLAELEEGVIRVYAEDRDPPRNKLARIMAEARASRRDSRRAVRELEEAREQAALPAAGSWAGEPVEGAYLAHGAIERVCPVCGAPAGDVCVNSTGGVEEVRRMPHFSRITSRPGR